MSAMLKHDDSGGRPTGGRPPSTALIVVTVCIVALVMLFAVILYKIRATELAVAAGMAGIGLASEIARRLLTMNSDPGVTDTSSDEPRTTAAAQSPATKEVKGAGPS